MAVWYITDTFLTHANLNSTLDGETNDFVNTRSHTLLLQRVIWQEMGLEYGEHTVIVTHQDGPGALATLDYFMLVDLGLLGTWDDIKNGTKARRDRYLPGQPPQKSSLPAGAIAGGVVGGVTLLAFCVARYMLAWRRWAAKSRSDIDLAGFNGPPLLSHDNGTIQPVAVPPAWGYVSTPYVPEANRCFNTSPARAQATQKSTFWIIHSEPLRFSGIHDFF
ncbi:hypothetical protein RSOLAG22IIIB_14191 [Rhizoctonia solani]|uniref:Uncharacterized protein n=1 Tax=Rhizoctonia solani TaxID=456999 RepID=A0A0K6FV12_9AGAM|nr:hypothetical protein RSOLAG22IIIB_14191 [Rhizoctonia solani]